MLIYIKTENLCKKSNIVLEPGEGPPEISGMEKKKIHPLIGEGGERIPLVGVKKVHMEEAE